MQTKPSIDWAYVWSQYQSWLQERFPTPLVRRNLHEAVCQKIQELVEAQLGGEVFTPDQEQFCENIDLLSKSHCTLPGYDLKEFLSHESRDLYERWRKAHPGKEADDDA